MTSDEAKGFAAVKAFHNYASFHFSNYNETIDTLISKLTKNRAVFLDAFGFTISSLEMDDSQVSDAMETLASDTDGKIPHQTVFFQALSRRVQNFTFAEAAKDVSINSAKDLAKGAQAAGDSIITTLKGLGFVLPFLVIGGLTFYVYKKVKNV